MAEKTINLKKNITLAQNNIHSGTVCNLSSVAHDGISSQEHFHEHDGTCCMHDQSSHQHSHTENHKHNDHAKKSLYILENLGCANCAAKMEAKIKQLPQIEDAVITFATKQLAVYTNNASVPVSEIQNICQSIENEVVVHEKNKAVSTSDEKQRINPLYYIGSGALLLVVGKVLENSVPVLSSIMLLTAYLILGAKIVLTAVKNLLKGQIFDENFLMSIATIGALIVGDYAEAVGVMLFYRVGEWFEHRAVAKSRSQIIDALDLRPEVVNRLDNTASNNAEVIDAAEASVGDILLIRPGDRIPLDGVVLSGESRIDTSPITGEPVPVKVSENDPVTSGCLNTSGVLKIKVEKVLEDSMVSRILDSVENAAASKPKIDRFITRFSRIYTPFVVALALFTAIVPSLITGDWSRWTYTALTFLIISCPCALVLSVPLAFFSGIGSGSRQGILFKGGVALEAIQNVKAIVMDKTGTITKGNFVVQNSVSLSDTLDENRILALAASCEMSSTHPIGQSIIAAAKAKNLPLENPLEIKEEAGKGIKAVFSFGEILCGNRKLMDSHNVPLNQYTNTSFGTEVFIAVNNILSGYIIISDTLKEESVGAINQMKRLGIHTVILTGDSQASADAIGKAVGVDEIYAKLLPEDKLSKLQEIRNKHGNVMFVGDGINDAPVLAGADVGAAMGSGADAAIEAADVVFMTSSMDAVPASISIARITNKIAKQNVIFALTIKILIMALGLAGFASMWMAVFADTGVSIICILNSVRILYSKKVA